MEHIISAETLDRIRDFLRKSKKDTKEAPSGEKT
jgi:Mn-dependent DtxR family transcriptional regulator